MTLYVKCDQPEAHARIAVFGRPNATIEDHVNGRACQYGMKHEPTRPTSPAETWDDLTQKQQAEACATWNNPPEQGTG